MIKNLKYHLVALIILQILLCLFYGYHRVYDKRPFSIHQWRQTDCASFTKNYYEEGMHFLKPAIHWQGNIEGKTVSEFPLINYTVACLWKVFGEHEYIYRFTILLIYIVAILFMFVMIYNASSSLIYSYFGTSIITTSPVLAYYSFSFLTDVPALSFAIIALSLFFIFLDNKKISLFIASVCCATIATLLKASASTVLLIIGFITLINLFPVSNKIFTIKKLFHSKLLPVLSFACAITIIFLWYRFAYSYNNGNSNGVFLMETLPIWKMKDKVIETARLLYSVQFSMCFNKGVLMLVTIVVIWLYLNLKMISHQLQIALLISSLTFIAFILLFFQVFNVHDYYLITAMIFPVIVLACFGNYLKNIKFNYREKIAATLLIIFIANAAYCASIIRLRNINHDELCKFYPFITNEEKNFSDWFHGNYESTLKPLETITPYLRSLGIKRTDYVLSAPDPSFNISLYLMDQKGITATAEQLQIQNTVEDFFKNKKIKYLILNDTSLLNTTMLTRVNVTQLGFYKNIGIYKFVNTEQQ